MQHLQYFQVNRCHRKLVWNRLKSASSVHHYHGKVYNLNNCTNGVVNCKTQPYRKRIRIIYSSDEEEE